MTRFPYHTLYCQVRIGGYQKGAVLNLKGVVVGGGGGGGGGERKVFIKKSKSKPIVKRY